jgi:hypothetical protein
MNVCFDEGLSYQRYQLTISRNTNGVQIKDASITTLKEDLQHFRALSEIDCVNLTNWAIILKIDGIVFRVKY